MELAEEKSEWCGGWLDMKFWWKEVGRWPVGEETPGGVGELEKEGALEPGGVHEPSGEAEYRPELGINAGGEPEIKYQ